ncbi:hypothetical protein RD792_008120 [Penstemon davidsonii]|uniref:Uncharacterized protein n=1 Tax=Penstemon davidsonii TaxID=160366 RepID=A0ABR0D896_9LAMI|nr:hypothetical protein RD792_008120 [Penstemon davidsonii]
MVESIKQQVRDSDFARRNANYKANIWDYEHLQSLTNQYDEEKCKREMEALKVEVSSILCAVENPLYYKLELIDEMNKFALSHYFEKDIFERVSPPSSAHLRPLLTSAASSSITRRQQTFVSLPPSAHLRRQHTFVSPPPSAHLRRQLLRSLAVSFRVLCHLLHAIPQVTIMTAQVKAAVVPLQR